MDEKDTLLNLLNLSAFSIDDIIELAFRLKNVSDRKYKEIAKGKVLVLYFEKKSTRTRLSAFSAWTKLGGSVIDLSPQTSTSHIGSGESLYDSFRVIATMADCILARVSKHETLLEIHRAISESGKRSVLINALCDKWHPLQILADILTICETDSTKYTKVLHEKQDDKDEVGLEKMLSGQKVTWIGDANNVMNELASTLPRFGCNFTACTPPGYPVSSEIHGEAITSGKVVCTNDPVEALKDANFVITDTWVSMGDEEEKEQRLKDFSPYRVNAELLDKAALNPNWKFLHCLPRKPEEVSDEIMYGEHSLVFSEAENRMWTIMSVFVMWFFQ